MVSHKQFHWYLFNGDICGIPHVGHYRYYSTTLSFSKTYVVSLLIHSILRGKNCTSAPARVQFFQRKIERINRPTRHFLHLSLSALCRELLDRAHDVMTVICDAPASWWPVKAVGRMDLKHVYFRNDSRHVHFGSRWLDEMVRSSVNTWWRHHKMFKILMQILSQQKPIWRYRWRAMELPSYMFLIFCQFHVNNDDITIVMRHAGEREWSIYSHGSETVHEIGVHRLFQSLNFRIRI